MATSKTLDDIHHLLDRRVNELHSDLRTLTDRVTRLEQLANQPYTEAPPPPRTAGPRLVAVPELLEHILLYLPMRDLLLAQRISKQVKGVIDGSPSIQHALFFMPKTSELGKACSRPVLNPLLSRWDCFKRIPLFVPGKDYFDWKNIKFCSDSARQRTHVAPVEAFIAQQNDDQSFVVRICMGTLPDGWRPNSVALDAASYGQGSWSRMYLSQPPCDIVISMVEDTGTPERHDACTLGELFPTKYHARGVGDAVHWYRQGLREDGKVV